MKSYYSRKSLYKPEAFSSQSLKNLNKKRKYKNFISKSGEKNNCKPKRTSESFNTPSKKIKFSNKAEINISRKKTIIPPQTKTKKQKRTKFISRSEEKIPLPIQRTEIPYFSTSKKAKISHKFAENTPKIENNVIKFPTPTLIPQEHTPLKSPQIFQLNSDNKWNNISAIEPNPNSTFLSNLHELSFDLPLDNTDLSNVILSGKKSKKLHFYNENDVVGGSFFRYSIQKANRIQKKLFGATSVITPVRSSKRLKPRIDHKEEILTVDQIKMEKELIYVPNELEKAYEPMDQNSVLLKAYLNKDFL